jgi:hypothetical protein
MRFKFLLIVLLFCYKGIFSQSKDCKELYQNFIEKILFSVQDSIKKDLIKEKIYNLNLDTIYDDGFRKLSLFLDKNHKNEIVNYRINPVELKPSKKLNWLTRHKLNFFKAYVALNASIPIKRYHFFNYKFLTVLGCSDNDFKYILGSYSFKIKKDSIVFVNKEKFLIKNNHKKTNWLKKLEEYW